jgi:hypothetical protein
MQKSFSYAYALLRNTQTVPSHVWSTNAGKTIDTSELPWVPVLQIENDKVIIYFQDYQKIYCKFPFSSSRVI